MQQQQKLDALKCKILLLESDLDKVESVRDSFVENKKIDEINLEEVNREITKMKQKITAFEGMLTIRHITLAIYQMHIIDTMKIEGIGFFIKNTCLNLYSYCSY